MKNWLKKLKKKAILPAAAFLVAAAAIGTTFAWQTWDLSVTNELKAHDTTVIVDENFNPDDGTKEVCFKNTGNSSVFLRVTYSEYWIKNESLDEDIGKVDWYENSDINVEPNWNGTTILPNKVDGKNVAEKKWASIWPESNSDSAKEWVNGKDGWFYYTGVLKPGDSTDKILDRIEFDKDLKDSYANANYRLFFKAEVVQCSDGNGTINSETVNKNATKSLFNRIAVVSGSGDTAKVTWYIGDLEASPDTWEELGEKERVR